MSVNEISIKVLCEADFDQLAGLENRYLAEIGEPSLTEIRLQSLRQAVLDGRIVFLAAKSSGQLVGMCSVSRCFSTFACGDVGIFEDFYVMPPFRGTGMARLLAMAAQQWCKRQGIASLTVACAPCDEAMYRSLGFDQRLGTQYAHIIQ